MVAEVTRALQIGQESLMGRSMADSLLLVPDTECSKASSKVELRYAAIA
jgi:hypothetical protein